MDDFYTDMRATADEMLREFGQSGFLRRVTGGTGGDPWNPSSQTGGSTTDYPVTIAPMTISTFDRNASLIQQGKDTVLMSAEGLDVVPSDKDRLVYADGSEHEIADVRPTAPSGTVVVYEMDVVR
jgi:hypothetical protein